MNAVRLARRWLIPVLVSLLLAHGGAVAHAETDKREIEARADFVAGRYQPALDLYAQLYAETLNPIFLRNVARCQQNLRQPQAAIDAFQEYLRKAKNLKADERQEIQGASRGGQLAHIDRRSQLARRDVEIHQWLDARVLVEMKVLSKMDERHLR